MWKSVKLFCGGVYKSIFTRLSFIALIYTLYEFIKPTLPPQYQRDLIMSGEVGLIIFIALIFLAGIDAYHKLRLARLEEFYKYAPEAKRDQIFRIFYELHKEGEFLKDANAERRQQWEEEIFKAIKDYCEREFEWIYLGHTGRRHQKYAPIEDRYHNNALEKLKELLDKDFDLFIRV